MVEKIPSKEKVTEYFEKKLKRKLTDAEILECVQSLFYLGRAIYKYNVIEGSRDGD